ncbi:MAG: nuclear transport factor 2 family protein [Novosphingobium sp.]|nr:nuclear transport factor 2 family protein [Novosphingobium sp.]
MTDLIAIAKSFYAALMGGRPEEALALWRDDFEIVEVDSMPYPGIYKGKDRWDVFFGIFNQTWAHWTLEIDDILANDRRVVAVGTFHGTARASGQDVSFPMAEIWDFEDGEMIRVTPVYGDTALINQATAVRSSA